MTKKYNTFSAQHRASPCENKENERGWPQPMFSTNENDKEIEMNGAAHSLRTTTRLVGVNGIYKVQSRFTVKYDNNDGICRVWLSHGVGIFFLQL